MLLFLLACAAQGDSADNTVTGPQDLSGYATAADLAALQEQVNAQAEEIEELRSIVDEQAAEAVIQVSATCTGDGSGDFTFATHIHVVQIAICQQVEGGARCYGPDPTGIGLYSYHRYDAAEDGVLSDLQVICDTPSDVVWVAYVVTD